MTDAVIFAKRIDMAPDAMQEMTAPLEQLPSTEPGVYRFKTDLMMQGRWQLSLGAKVQGEEGAVETKLNPIGTSELMTTTGAAQTNGPAPSGPVIYYRDPDGMPFYSLEPKQTPDGRPYRAVCQRRHQL